MGRRCKMNLSKSMLRYRADNNISQRELASRCNVNYHTIRKAEQGRMVTELTEYKIRKVVGGDEQDGMDIFGE
jgi:transcriptional regulator with XRE-family HTH domain